MIADRCDFACKSHQISLCNVPERESYLRFLSLSFRNSRTRSENHGTGKSRYRFQPVHFVPDQGLLLLKGPIHPNQRPCWAAAWPAVAAPHSDPLLPKVSPYSGARHAGWELVCDSVRDEQRSERKQTAGQRPRSVAL